MGSNLCCQQTKNSNTDQIDINVVRSQPNTDSNQPIVVSIHEPTGVQSSGNVQSGISQPGVNQPGLHQSGISQQGIYPPNSTIKQSSISNTNTQPLKPNTQLTAQTGLFIQPLNPVPIALPSLSKEVNDYIYSKQPLSDKNLQSYQPAQCRANIYQGEINHKGEPDGFGRMFYPNGNVIYGKFKNGHVDGDVHYVWADGSYYQGNVEKNTANDKKGFYYNQNYTYKGNVKNNQMTGEGVIQGKKFRYVGKLENGRKKQGELQWKQIQTRSTPGNLSQIQCELEYKYTGKFDQNQKFTGEGTLISQKGTYKGNFVNNLKHGKGLFLYKNGLKYEGDYNNDIREGFGTIFSKAGIIVYQGQIRKGLPHGKGRVPNASGQLVQTQWVEGVSKNLLMESQLLQK